MIEYPFNFLHRVVESPTNPELDPSLAGPLSYFTGTSLPNPGGANVRAEPEGKSRGLTQDFSPVFSWQIPDPSTMLALWYRKLWMNKDPSMGSLGFHLARQWLLLIFSVKYRHTNLPSSGLQCSSAVVLDSIQ